MKIETNEYVAVKRMSYSADNWNDKAQIETEISKMHLAKSCNYSVRCHDVYHFPGNAYWVFFDLMEGGSFANLLNKLENRVMIPQVEESKEL